MKATVLVRPKPGILDPQGEAVESSLRQLGFAVADARIGRVVDLEVEASDAAAARAEVERMCQQLLANPLIEIYEIELQLAHPSHASPSSRFPARTTTATHFTRSTNSALPAFRCGTPRNGCPTLQASFCQAASPTATTSAAARSRASRRPCMPSPSSQPPEGWYSGSATASRFFARQGSCPARSDRTIRSHFSVEMSF